MAHREGDVLRCSFCGKSQHEVRKLIAGPTVYICNECVEVCLDIIAEDRVHEAKARQQVLAKPPEIKAYIDEYVIGQETAKKKLVVAVYNAVRYLEFILAALERQSTTDFEVVIADDGSGPEIKSLVDQVKAVGIEPRYVASLNGTDGHFPAIIENLSSLAVISY